MNEVHTLTFYIDPVPASRPRVTRWRTYIAEPYASYKKELEAMVADVWDIDPLTKPLQVDIEIYVKRPKKPSNPFPHPDWDNYAKGVCDAMNEVVYLDDKQIVAGGLVKRFAEPGEDGYIVVELQELD